VIAVRQTTTVALTMTRSFGRIYTHGLAWVLTSTLALAAQLSACSGSNEPAPAESGGAAAGQTADGNAADAGGPPDDGRGGASLEPSQGGSDSAASTLGGADGWAGERSGVGAVAGDGGETTAAQCDEAPLLIARSDSAWALVVDHDYVYWTTHRRDGQVLRAPVTGGTSEVVAASELFPHALAVANGQVFWSALGMQPGHLFQADVSGAGRRQLATGVSTAIYGVSADADAVYYVTDLNVLTKVPLDGGAPVELSGAPYDSVIVDVALQGSTLYWTNHGVGIFEPTESGSALLMSVDTSGATPPVTLLNRLEFPQFQIAVDEGGVLWNDDTALFRTSKLGGTPGVVTPLPRTPLASSPITDLVSDGTSAFYSDGTSVYRVPIAGGTPEIVTQGWSRIMQLGLDAEHVYLSDYLAGAVFRLPKCATAFPAPVIAPSARSATRPAPPAQAEQACDEASALHGCPEPTVVATVSHPFGLATDEGYVYFSTYEGGQGAGTVQRVPLAGGPAEPIATDEPGPHDIAVDANNVYWCLNDGAGHLAKAPKAGGERKTMAAGLGAGLGRVTSDGSFAYFITLYNTIYRVNVDGDTMAMLAAGPYGSNAKDLAVYDGEVFWLNDGLWNDDFTAKIPNTGYLGRAPVSGSSNLGHTELASELDSTVARVAVDAAHVFYIDDTSIYRGDRAGGEPLAIAELPAGTTQVVDLLVDEGTLYFADLQAVYRLRPDSSTVETLSSHFSSLRSIAVDDTSIYFTDYAGGAVMKRPK
jgi:hypothetical protein